VCVCVCARIDIDLICRSQDDSADAVKTHFPFTEYFASAPQPLFSATDKQQDLEIAEGCLRHLQRIFDSLEEIRPFELLRSSYDRTNYLLIKQAKIIAMTCTHAALKVGLARNDDDDVDRIGTSECGLRVTELFVACSDEIWFRSGSNLTTSSWRNQHRRLTLKH
jgi:hypothetical protein